MVAVLVRRPEGWEEVGLLTVTVTVAVTTAGCSSQVGGSRGGVESTQGAPSTENFSVCA